MPNPLQSFTAVKESAGGPAAPAGNATPDPDSKNVFLTTASLTFPATSLAGAALLRFLDSNPDKWTSLLIAAVLGSAILATGLGPKQRTMGERYQEVVIGLVVLLAAAIYGGATVPL